MGNVAFNAYKHKIGWYFEQARDTSADIGALLVVSAGNPSDATLVDFTTLTALLAGTADEATFTNYARKILPLGGTPVTIDNTLERVVLTAASPITWATAGGALNNTLARIVFYYDPTPGTSTDTTRLPLTAQDIAVTTDGNNLVITLSVDGIALVRA